MFEFDYRAPPCHPRNAERPFRSSHRRNRERTPARPVRKISRTAEEPQTPGETTPTKLSTPKEHDLLGAKPRGTHD